MHVRLGFLEKKSELSSRRFEEVIKREEGFDRRVKVLEADAASRKAAERLEEKAKLQRGAVEKKEIELREKEESRRKREWERMRQDERERVSVAEIRALRDAQIDEAEGLRDAADQARSSSHRELQIAHHAWEEAHVRREREGKMREAAHAARSAEAQLDRRNAKETAEKCERIAGEALAVLQKLEERLRGSLRPKPPQPPLLSKSLLPKPLPRKMIPLLLKGPPTRLRRPTPRRRGIQSRQISPPLHM